MAGGYSTPSMSQLGKLFDTLSGIQRQSREIGRPTGTQTADALQQLRDLINGVLEQTSVNVAGNITTTAGYVVSPVGPTFDITTGRVAAWWRTSDGRLAFASSSREKKTNIVDADIDPTAILAISVRAFNYRAEIAKRDDPDSPEYVGPDYHVALEFGGIAEEFHELGLWQVVIYKDHWKPIGLHYELIGLLAVKAAQHIWATLLDERSQRQALERRVEALEILLGF